MTDIYLWIDGKRAGPYTPEHVAQGLADGRFAAHTPAIREGSTQWMRADRLWVDPSAASRETGPRSPSALTADQAPAAGPSPLADQAPVAQHSDLGQSDLVQVEHVTKTFGAKTALSEVTFAVPRGQICGLLGPNGAGKTTLFRLLMGILKATEGRLLIEGKDAFEDRVATKRLIGFLPDEPVFYSYLSGQEILELSAAMHGLDVPATMARIRPWLGKLRLMGELGNFAEEYSRGMKKKLGLLLAMLHQPSLLILDEPTNGLDVEATHLFYDMIHEVAHTGTTVLFSTHLMDHVTKLCSHAVIIDHGRLIAKGSLAELCAAYGQASLEEVFLALTARPASP